MCVCVCITQLPVLDTAREFSKIPLENNEIVPDYCLCVCVCVCVCVRLNILYSSLWERESDQV